MLLTYQQPHSSQSQVLMLFPGMDTVLQPGGELVPGLQPAGQLAQGPWKSKLSQRQAERSHPPPKSHVGWAWGGSHRRPMPRGALVLTSRHTGHKWKEGWTGPWEKGAIPTGQLGLTWRQHPSSCLSWAPGSLLHSCELGARGCSGPRSGKSLSITPTSPVPTCPKAPPWGQDAHERRKGAGRTRIRP